MSSPVQPAKEYREMLTAKVRSLAYKYFNPVVDIELDNSQSLHKWGLDTFDMSYFSAELHRLYHITVPVREPSVPGEIVSVNTIVEKIINKLNEQIKE